MKKIIYILILGIFLTSCNTYIPCATYAGASKNYTPKNKQATEFYNYNKKKEYKKHHRDIQRRVNGKANW